MTDVHDGGRWFRAQGPSVAVLLLVSVIAAGTLGYVLIEGWSVWDAFYMTVITVSTVGYKEVHDLAMEEITIASRSTLANQSILDANLRQRYGVIVVGIQRLDRRMEFNPEPTTAILPGDKPVVLGRPDSLRRLETEAAA